MTNLPIIAELRRTALDTIATLHALSPTDQLAPVWAVLRGREVVDRLAILDRDAAALLCPKEREAARRAAEEVRDALRAPHPSASPANSGSA